VSGAGHRVRVLALLAEQPPDPQRLPDLALSGIDGLDAAAVVVATFQPTRSGAYLSGALATRMEDLQLVLGEGPGVDALTDDRPVLVADLGEDEHLRRWPAFAPAATAAGARAVFALPLRIGVVRTGVLDLYRAQPGPLSTEAVEEALVIADVIALHLMMDGHEAATSDLRGLEPRRKAVVHQATGIIMAELNVGVEEAAIRLRAYSYSDGRTLAEVAEDVVARRLRFDKLGD
jgi:hypothetical protein